MNRKLLFVSISLLLMVVALIGAAAANTTRVFSPVQEGFVRSGDDAAPYALDRILVKFTTNSFSSSKLGIGLQRGAPVPGAETGIASVDALSRDVGVLKVARAFIDVKDRVEGERTGVDRWFMLTVPAGTDIMNVVDRYKADPNVEHANPDWIAFPAAIPSDPMYPDHWGHNNTGQLPDYDWGGTWDHTGPPVGTPGFDANAQPAWDASQGFGSSNVIVAIIDTGVDLDHPDLTLVAGWDYGDNDSNPDDNSAAAGHGTCCAGVAAAKVNNGLGACGIAPGCRVMPLKVANSAGSLYFSSIINAIYHAADNGAHIISMSLGAYLSSDPSTDAAIQYAYNAGLVILAATSNDNYSYISYPAIHANVIGVGAASPCGDRKRSSSNSAECNPGVATDPNGYTCDGERWWGSNYGTNVADAAGAVDILGPTILTTTDIAGSGGYRSGDYEPFFNGTSCATPYVAGVCALIKSQNPSWTPAQIRDQLVSTAIDIVNVESGSGWDRYSGYGMVDAEAAVGGGGPVPPVAAFTGSPTSGDMPLTVNFTDQSTGSPTSWSWTFGDGGTSSAQNPSHTYTAAGTYTVSLTATNAVGSDIETKVGYITVTNPPPPTAAFTGSPTSGTYPLNVSFTDQSTGAPTSWDWTFGDGGTSTAQHPSHTYTAAGIYTVSLTVTNAYGFDDEIKVNYITVTEPGVTTFVTAAGETPVAGTVSGSYLNTQTSDDSRETITEVIFVRNANKRYSYLEHRWNFTLPAGGDVIFHLEASRTNNSEGDDFVFDYSTDGVLWSPLVTVSSATETAYSAALGTLSGTVTVRASDASHVYGGEVLDVLSVDYMAFEVGDAQPQPPVANFVGSPSSGTAPLTVNFTDQSSGSPTSWIWDFGDGVGTSSQQNPSYTYQNPGSYTVSLTATNAYGSDAETKANYITVTESGTTVMHVFNIVVTRKVAGPNNNGVAEVTVVDQGGAPVSGAMVSGYFSAPNTSTKSALTGTNGVALLQSDKTKSPPPDFCFTVTGVALGGATYDSGANAVNTACESGWAGGGFAVSSFDNRVPGAFSLFQNSPNPFHVSTGISYGLPRSEHVTLEVFNVAGQRVAVLVNETVGPGVHTVNFDVSKHASGIYFYRLKAGSFVQTKKMILIR